MSAADKEEYLNIYSSEGVKIGTEIRSIVHKKQLFHKEVAIWIINSKRELLLEKRSVNKALNPGKLSLCAGHVVGNDSVEDTIIREAKEEIGLDITNLNYKYVICVKREEDHNFCFSYHYFLNYDVSLSELKIQEAELSEVVYMDYELFKSKVKNADPGVALIWSDAYQKVFNEIDKNLA